jgi:hypothetical protein
VHVTVNGSFAGPKRTQLDPNERASARLAARAAERFRGHAALTHSPTGPPVLLERIVAGLLELLERLALSLLPETVTNFASTNH